MLNFLEYLREGFLIEAKSKPISTKNPSDSFGKIHEILVGKHLNNGSFPEDYRVEGKRPVDIHNAHAKARFGKQFESQFGTHKKTGKKMEVHRVSVYMGGAHETANPRGATTLASEGHKSIDTSKQVK